MKFVVIGNIRSGTSMVQDALAQHPQAMCLGHVVSANCQVRIRAQELYFSAEDLLTSNVFGEFYPQRFIEHNLWWAGRAECYRAFGCLLHYHDVDYFDLWDYFEEHPEITVIHVARNPICCYTSLVQARRTGIWRMRAGQRDIPARSVMYRPDDLEQFMDDSRRCVTRLKQSAARIHEVRYSHLHCDYTAALRGVWKALKIADFYPVPRTKKLRPGYLFTKVPHLTMYRSRISPEFHEHFQKDLV